MQLLVHSDHNIQSAEGVSAQVTSFVGGALDGVAQRIARVDVHLNDGNSDKKGGTDAMRCTMEARVEGFSALVVTHQHATLKGAVDGAAGKLARLVSHTLQRRHDGAAR